MDEPRARADARLDEALAGGSFEDPRALYRDRLKELRTLDPAGFARARTYFDTTLVPAVAAGEDALQAWVSYGRLMAEIQGPGRVLAVDGSGRARPFPGSPRSELVLFVPDDDRRAVLTLLAPSSPTAAQQATVDLLIRGRRELQT